jgi:hypothetical protein
MTGAGKGGDVSGEKAVKNGLFLFRTSAPKWCFEKSFQETSWNHQCEHLFSELAIDSLVIEPVYETMELWHV